MFKKITPKTKDDDVAHALNAALRCLTRREYSRIELIKKLNLRYTKNATDAAVKKCVENKWQSDERYAQMLFNHIVNQCYGPRKLMLEASKKGLSQSYYQEYLEETDWTEIAVKFLKKRLEVREYTFEEQQKILASVARRGFSNSSCISALQRFLSEE